MTGRDFLADAERLAPVPATREQATSEAWQRHFVAQALAAHATFRMALDAIPAGTLAGERRDLGWLSLAATSATATAVALDPHEGPLSTPGLIWDLSFAAGAINGEHMDWLSERADRLGINPADVYPWYEAADFETPRAELPVAVALLATACPYCSVSLEAQCPTHRAYPVVRCGQRSAHGPHVVDHGPDQPRNCPGTADARLAAAPAAELVGGAS